MGTVPWIVPKAWEVGKRRVVGERLGRWGHPRAILVVGGCLLVMVSCLESEHQTQLHVAVHRRKWV